MTTDHGHERRGHARHPASLRVTVQAGAQRFDAVCTNIGPGGAFVQARLQPLPGTVLQLAVWPTEPGSVLLLLDAIVVYVVHPGRQRPAGLGVRWQRRDDPRLTQLLKTMVDRPELERQTGEFDWERVGSEGTGVTRQMAAARATVQPGDPDEPIVER
jgi:hypothetical protein